VRAAAEDQEIDLHHRDLVQLDEPHWNAVGELLLLNLWKLQRRRRADLRRMGTVGDLLGEPEGRRRTDYQPQSTQRPQSFVSMVIVVVRRCRLRVHFFSGSTMSSTLRSSGRYCAAAARMSAGDRARYRLRSSLNQSGFPVSLK